MTSQKAINQSQKLRVVNEPDGLLDTLHPDALNTFRIGQSEALLAAREIGKFFSQLPTEPRDRLTTMLRNKARMYSKTPNGAGIAAILLTVVSNSSNFSNDDSRLLANLALELQRMR